MRSICNHVRPDRQTLLFSATFKKRVERLARDVLTDPVRIVQGDVGEANTDVTQVCVFFFFVGYSYFLTDLKYKNITLLVYQHQT